MSNNILLISDTMIKERTAIHGNIDPKLIYPDIKVAQDMYIHPLLGSALYDKLQALVSSGQISDVANVNYKTLLDKFLVDTLMYYVLTEMPVTISYQFWNKGVMRKGSDSNELPTMSDLIDLSNKYKNRAEFYAERMRLWLVEKAVTMYPEYLNPGNTADTLTPEQRAFSSPIFLGDDDYPNPYCNRGGFNGQPYSE